MKRNMNSIGSVIPPTAAATTADIRSPFTLVLFSAKADLYIASAAPLSPNINVGIFPWERNLVYSGDT